MLEGKVAVDADGHEQSLVAGERVSRGADGLRVEPLDAAAAARDWALLDRAPQIVAQARDEPPNEGVRAAAVPLDASAASEPAPPVVDDAASPRAAVTKPPRRSAPRLLADARASLGRGEIRAAVRTYEDLIASHPRTAEAHAACVSVGDLYLARLGNARTAARWFRRYLADGGGSLAPEARHGLVRAARMLGDDAAERAAIEAFVRAHPRDGRVATLRQRLTSLTAAAP